MNEKQINEKMLNAFPELKEEFDKYVSWQDGMATGAFLTNALSTKFVIWLAGNESAPGRRGR